MHGVVRACPRSACQARSPVHSRRRFSDAPLSPERSTHALHQQGIMACSKQSISPVQGSSQVCMRVHQKLPQPVNNAAPAALRRGRRHHNTCWPGAQAWPAKGPPRGLQRHLKEPPTAAWAACPCRGAWWAGRPRPPPEGTAGSSSRTRAAPAVHRAQIGSGLAWGCGEPAAGSALSSSMRSRQPGNSRQPGKSRP